MNYIKYLKFIVTSIILSICILMPAELFQLYASEMGSGYYKTTFYLPDGGDIKEMNSDLSRKAKENDLLIFMVKGKSISAFEYQMDIYADDDALEYIKTERKVEGRRYKSLLAGETNIVVHSFSEAPIPENTDSYTLVGNVDNMDNFKQELVGKYSGSFPKCLSRDQMPTMIKTYGAAWLMLILLCCVMTLYECAYQKKENFIRMTLGEDLNKHVIKNIAIDAAFFSALFLILKAISVKISGKMSFLSGVTWIAFAVLLLANSLSYAKLKPKKVASLTGYDKASVKLLSANYVIKSVCVILSCLVISTNIACIYEGIDYYNQKSFFEEHSDYYSYNAFSVKSQSEDDDYVDSDEVEEKLYDELHDDMEFFQLCNEAYVGSRDIAFANYNTKDYLASRIKGFGDLDFKKECYVLLPKSEKFSDDELEQITSWTETDDYEIFYYESTSGVVIRTLDANPNTVLSKKPIIIFSQNEDELPGDTILYLTMIKTDKQKLESFAEENDLTYSETNIMDYFNYRMLTFKRIIYVNCILSALIILIEILVTATVIRLEYSVNSVYLAVKKILGYSDFERFSTLYKILISLWAVSTVAAVLLSKFLDLGNFVFVLIGAVIMLVFDLAIISVNTWNYDRKNIQRILKGGAL